MGQAEKITTTGENMRVIGGITIAGAILTILATSNMLVVIMAVMAIFGGAFIIIQGQKLILSVDEKDSSGK